MAEHTSTPVRSTHDVTTESDRHGVVMQTDIVRSPFARGALAFLRVVLGWFFLWPFFDKLFGLGYATPSERAWLNGGSPTKGFLSNAEGAFAGIFKAMAPAAPILDWIFMAGLLGIGVAVLLGAGLKIAAITGTLLVGMMYLASFPWGMGGTNPLLTTHWIEGACLVVLAATRAGDTFGLGRWWSRIVGDGILR